MGDVRRQYSRLLRDWFCKRTFCPHRVERLVSVNADGRILRWLHDILDLLERNVSDACEFAMVAAGRVFGLVNRPGAGRGSARLSVGHVSDFALALRFDIMLS